MRLVGDEDTLRQLLLAELEDEIVDWDLDDLAELLDYARFVAMTEPHERPFRRCEN